MVIQPNKDNTTTPPKGDNTTLISMKTGIELITEERHRQINVEGWTAEHDNKHDDQSLLGAAVCYVERTLMGKGITVYKWPWEESSFKPSDDIRNLVKAGALIVAEIDRLLIQKPKSNEKH